MHAVNVKPTSRTKKGQRTRGLDRAFHILDYLHSKRMPLRPSEIAQGIGAPRSTTYDVIRLMLEHAILEACDSEGRVFFARKLYFYGQTYLQGFDLTREATDYLDRLTRKTGETAQLCMMEHVKHIVVLTTESARHFKISVNIGERLPLPWTASGRILMSHLTDDEIRCSIPAEDFALPDGTKLDVEKFLKQVQHARDERFFSCQSVSDNFTYCFASPIYDESMRCIATLCLVAPREDALRDHGSYKEILITSATQLSNKLRG